MNFAFLISFVLFALSIIMVPVLAGGKDDETIIIGEGGQILYKGGGKKVSLKDLLQSLQITLTIETYERTTIRLSSRDGGEVSDGLPGDKKSDPMTLI